MSRHEHRVRPTVIRLLFALGLLGLLNAAAGQTSPPQAESVLRVARSADGLTFRDAGVIVAERASSPGLLRLPDSQVVAVFDDRTVAKGPALAVVRSRDGGRTWSRPQPVRLTAQEPLRVRAAHGELLALPDGTVRLYFIIGGGPRTNRSVAGPGPMIVAAVSRDGLAFRMDNEVPIPLEDAVNPHLALLGGNPHTHMFVTEDDPPQATNHYEAANDLVFRPRGDSPESMPAARTFVSTGRGYRAYCCGEEGVTSMVSPDGTKWTREPGVRFAGRWDPAVVRLADGSFLMVYAPVSEPSPPADPVARETIARGPADTDKEQVEGRTASVRRVFKLGLPCLQYAEKHGGALPPDLQTLVADGLLAQDALTSPQASDTDDVSYIYIEGQRNTMDPRNIVAYENPELHGNAGTVSVFLDGHAAWMNAEQFETALDETMKRLGR